MGFPHASGQPERRLEESGYGFRAQPPSGFHKGHAFAGGEPLGDQGIEPDQHLGVDFRLRGKPDGFGFEDSMDQDRYSWGLREGLPDLVNNALLDTWKTLR